MSIVPDTGKKKYNKMKHGKDYNEFLGIKINMLTILELLPRERDAEGRLKAPECLCQCDCGKQKKLRLYDVVNNNVMSCGCMRGKSGVDKDQNVSESIIDALAAVYFCEYTTNTCVRSKKLNLCCHECDRFKNCTQRCESSPDSCGARIRDDIIAIKGSQK